jgi:predicted metal-dependent phosphoesterase TrpH
MIDLHTHTNCSDGDYSPKELIELAIKQGITILSIADHDTVTAYNDNLVSYAKSRGVTLIPGVEFSTVDQVSKQKIHVVGLNIDLNNQDLLDLCAKLNRSRRNSVIKTKELLKPLGFILRSNKLLSSGSTVTKAHIGRDVIDNPDNKNKFLEIYGKVPLQGTFIEDYLIKGKPAFVDNEFKLFSAEAVKVIKKAGGVAICAHPAFNVMRGFSFNMMKDLIIRNKFDGLEAINIQYNKSNNDEKFDMIKEFSNFAEEANLLISGGSDYHSSNSKLWGNHSELGLKNEKYKITDELVKIILEKTKR